MCQGKGGSLPWPFLFQPKTTAASIVGRGLRPADVRVYRCSLVTTSCSTWESVGCTGTTPSTLLWITAEYENHKTVISFSVEQIFFAQVTSKGSSIQEAEEGPGFGRPLFNINWLF